MMFHTVVSFACLAAEANLVVALRLRKISLGGMPAWDESLLMVSEKVRASASATAHLAAGASVDSVVANYRTIVQANARRLSA